MSQSNKGPLLQITSRCLSDDLGFESLDARRDPIELDHELCRAFVAMRRQSPIGTEKLQPISTNAEVYTLHAGRWRGATWHDEENNAVWLLGAGFHRSGERDDAYPYLKGLDAKGELFPDVSDYEILFERQDHSFAQAVVEEVPQLITQARAQPGKEIFAIVADRIRVSLLVEIADTIEARWVAISMKLLPGDTDLPPEWMPILLAGFFPEVSNPLELQVAQDFPTRNTNPDEQIFVWYGD